MSDVKQTVSDMTGVGSDNINVLTVMYLTNATAATAGQNTGRKLLVSHEPMCAMGGHQSVSAHVNSQDIRLK